MQAFATIKSSTQISDIEEIVKIFVSLEQRNFSFLAFEIKALGPIMPILRSPDLREPAEPGPRSHSVARFYCDFLT